MAKEGNLYEQRKRLPRLFLTYANNCFRDNPENLSKVFEEILSCTPDTEFKSNVDTIIKAITSFAKQDDPEVADEHRKQASNEWNSWLLDTAFEAVYRYREGYCPDECFECTGIDYYQILKKNRPRGKEQLKCYECYQYNFINILLDIVDGKDYRDFLEFSTFDEEQAKRFEKFDLFPPFEIGDEVRHVGGNNLEDYLKSAYQCVDTEARITDEGNLEKVAFISLTNLTSEVKSHYEVEYKFNHYVSSVIGYSLTEFLLNNDRRKIKFCEECKKFFISKTVRPSRFCSNKCRMKHHHSKPEYKEKKAAAQREKHGWEQRTNGK